MHAELPAAVARQLDSARTVLEQHLGERITAIHLFGSACMGGLAPGSDIDLLVTVSKAPDEATRRALMVALLDVSAPAASGGALRPLEVTVLSLDAVVPWRYPARRELQFGEWLRADLQAGRFEPPMLDHDLAILLSKVRQHGVSLMGARPALLFDAVPAADLAQAMRDTIAQWNGPEDWAGEEVNIVLALARIWYSTVTGGITSKAAAADWLMDRLPAANRRLLEKAKAVYLGVAEDDLPEYPDEVAAFIAHARAEISALIHRCGDGPTPAAALG